MGGATALVLHRGLDVRISIHAPRGGCDSFPCTATATSSNFNPRTPWGVRQELAPEDCPIQINFNPRTPWGVRRKLALMLSSSRISIHAPRGGCDPGIGLLGMLSVTNFNPRTPWGVRLGVCVNCSIRRNFNPRTPWGVRQRLPNGAGQPGNFNPRTPWGVRLIFSRRFKHSFKFQSTHPVGGATFHVVIWINCDVYFNPRTPWGVRRVFKKPIRSAASFQSTHPVGGATAKVHKIHCAFCDKTKKEASTSGKIA